MEINYELQLLFNQKKKGHGFNSIADGEYVALNTFYYLIIFHLNHQLCLLSTLLTSSISSHSSSL